ncbi:1-phosphatidylinositol 4,5-bisphosphate phosphodiesterase classes I and II [Eumeta japonica]|uniref:1-phosphatidylinositol 4,5-bisphosphate phosphodiesterase classes I and II n=1 Tax=Eumeta variegata TaxID=151549 RepID=A0A4C1SBF5_EUMVA|nr:1-phosphatidylinositol 4,5-bisphosphate phosphodiesterase classes I and II [Eumeta japonica]
MIYYLGTSHEGRDPPVGFRLALYPGAASASPARASLYPDRELEPTLTAATVLRRTRRTFATRANYTSANSALRANVSQCASHLLSHDISNERKRTINVTVVRLFAQHKDDKRRVEKALSESGLPIGKNDTISLAKFQFEDFFGFYKNLTQRIEVQKIFNSLTDSKPHMSATQLVNFLNEVQRDPRLNEILHPYADMQRAKDLIVTHEHNKYHQQRAQLTFDGFLSLSSIASWGAVNDLSSTRRGGIPCRLRNVISLEQGTNGLILTYVKTHWSISPRLGFVSVPPSLQERKVLDRSLPSSLFV